jgi:hypothetical protein
MPDLSISQRLADEYGVRGKPGTKVECPFCHQPYLFIKSDDTLAKCFFPACGRYLTAQHQDPFRRGFYGLLSR